MVNASLGGRVVAPPDCVILWRSRKTEPFLVQKKKKKKDPGGTGCGISYTAASGRFATLGCFLVSCPPNPMAPPHPVAVLPTIPQALGR